MRAVQVRAMPSSFPGVPDLQELLAHHRRLEAARSFTATAVTYPATVRNMTKMFVPRRRSQLAPCGGDITVRSCAVRHTVPCRWTKVNDTRSHHTVVV
jgi:hypothetical protein